MNKPNIPEEIWIWKKFHFVRTEWKVNGWMQVAIIISLITDLGFPEEIKKWQLALRAVIAIAPFLATLLWIRSLARWIRGMDELHQRIVVAACLFATGATLCFVSFWHILDKAGIWEAVLHLPALHSCSSAFDAVWMVDALLMVFYFYGYRIFNRRYQ